MKPDLSAAAAASPLRGAMDGLDTALQHLIKVVEDGALGDLGAVSLVGFLQEFEQFCNQLPVVDRAAIQYGMEHDIPNVLNERSMSQVLTRGLRLSATEARRRVRSAEQLGDRRSMTGEPLTPIRPHLAAAQRTGEITPEQVAIIDQALRGLDRRGFDPAEIEAGEELLAGFARDLGPQELATAAGKVVDAIDPDGEQPDDAEQQDRRFLHLRKRPDGSWRGEFRLTPQAGQKLHSLLDALAKPKATHTEGSGEGVDDNGEGDGGAKVGKQGKRDVPDPRTRGQRLHDALEDLLDRLLRSDSPPDTGGTPTTVIILVDVDDLHARSGTGHYSDGTPVAADTVADLVDQADVAWCVKSRKGAVLNLFRDRRIATRPQTLALYARDGGCSFPGCDVPPEYCERHHIVSWLDGGPTNLTNLTLVCRFHHHYFEQSGWVCRINSDGLPAWIPPTWLDRAQKPILHSRIKVDNWQPQDPLDL